MKITILFFCLLIGTTLAAQTIENIGTPTQNYYLKKAKEYYYKSNFDSMNLYNDSLLWTSNKSKTIEYETAYIKAFYFSVSGNIDSSTFYIFKIQELALKEKNDNWMINSKIIEADLLNKQNKSDAAVNLLEELKFKALNTRDTILISDLYLAINRSFMNSDIPNHTEKAINYITKSLAITTGKNYERNNSKAKYYLANCYFLKANYKEALDLANDCEQLFKKYENFRNYQMILLFQSRCYIKLNQPEKAKEVILNCLAFGKSKNDYDIARMSYNALIEFEENAGNYKTALEYNKEFHDYDDTINSEKNKLALATAKVQFEKKLKEQENELLKNEVGNKKTALEQYKSLFWITSISLLFGGIIYFFHNQSKRKRQELIQQRIETESQLRHLRAQLNPHFMHNLFNTIYLQVVEEKDVEKLRNFVHEISHFFRDVLVLNERNYHSLENELKFINNFLLLQQKICSAPLTWNINIEETVDEENHNVPTMILQPIVENCIKHGFQNGSRAGHIDIQLNLETNHKTNKNEVVCYIKDNGVGKLSQSKANDLERKGDVGIKNCEERLQLARTDKSPHSLVAISFTELNTVVKIYL